VLKHNISCFAYDFRGNEGPSKWPSLTRPVEYGEIVAGSCAPERRCAGVSVHRTPRPLSFVPPSPVVRPL